MYINPEIIGNNNEEEGLTQESLLEVSPLTEAETSDLADQYKVSTRPSNLSISGAAILTGALAMSVAEEAPAAPNNKAEAQEQAESTERAVVKKGVVNHPTLGTLTFSIFRKSVDMSKPTFDGNMYGINVDGQDLNVINSRFIRNGAGSLTFQLANGEKATLQFPNLTESLQGKKAEFEAGGEKVTVE